MNLKKKMSLKQFIWVYRALVFGTNTFNTTKWRFYLIVSLEKKKKNKEFWVIFKFLFLAV